VVVLYPPPNPFFSQSSPVLSNLSICITLSGFDVTNYFCSFARLSLVPRFHSNSLYSLFSTLSCPPSTLYLFLSFFRLESLDPHDFLFR
jgi:hypothetical protein